MRFQIEFVLPSDDETIITICAMEKGQAVQFLFPLWPMIGLMDRLLSEGMATSTMNNEEHEAVLSQKEQVQQAAVWPTSFPDDKVKPTSESSQHLDLTYAAEKTIERMTIRIPIFFIAFPPFLFVVLISEFCTGFLPTAG